MSLENNEKKKEFIVTPRIPLYVEKKNIAQEW